MVTGFLRWLDALGSGQELALWAALSISLYVVGAQLAWRTRNLESGFLGENIRWLDGWRFRSLAWQLLRFLYYVVIPYGLLVGRRLLSGRMLGVVGAQPNGFLGWEVADWLSGLGWGLVCGLAGLVLVGGMWWALARRLDRETPFYLHRRPPAGTLFWDALFLQSHWALYRAAASTWLDERELYWGAFVGLLLLGLEAVGDPSLYFDSQWPSLAGGWVRLAAVACLTTVCFTVTRNIWVGMALHWAMTWALNVLGGYLSRWSLDASADRG